MADNYFAGRHGDLLHAATSSAALVSFGALQDFQLNVSAEPIEVTNNDSGGYRENVDGIKEWDFTADALMVSTNATAEHENIRSYLSTATRRWFAMANDAVGSTGYHWQGYAYVSGWGLSMGETRGVQLNNFSLVGDGVLVESST